MLTELELDVLRAIRRNAAHHALITAARVAGAFGEHAWGWTALGALGWLLDAGPRRTVWLLAALAAVVAHGTAVIVKRVARRHRPDAADLPALCRTPSRLSFPSAHACSTTAACLALTPVIGVPLAVAVIAAMGLSRLLLGVHYPTDVLAGVGIGTLAALVIA